jgi:dihydroorotate dehydrogenase
MFDVLRSILFRVDPERAHNLSLRAIKYFHAGRDRDNDPRLSSTIGGLTFPTPIGLAAGYDKDAQVPDAMLGLGFGFVEVGTLTPLPQVGNPKPRLFRLVEDEGVINRMGFNNGGQGAAHMRLSRRARRGVVGVNVGANKDAEDRIADYARGVRAMADVADYLTVNISSPNTPGLRGLQDAGALTELLDAITEVRCVDDPPLFLKVAPDLDTDAIDQIARVTAGRINALIIGNTTVSRPALRAASRNEVGGLSGAPLRLLARQKLCDFRRATGGAMPLIAAGGIDSADEAWARIKAGASLVQLYSALVFHGPGLVRAMTRGLSTRMEREGFATLADAIGVDAR